MRCDGILFVKNDENFDSIYKEAKLHTIENTNRFVLWCHVLDYLYWFASSLIDG